MKLLRFGEPGTEKPGVLINNEILDVSAFGEDFGEKFFETDGIARLQDWLKKNTSLPKVKGVRIGAPFTRPSKIICVGLNYTKHALESQMDIPKEPIIFFKSTTALVGPTDDLIIPRNSVKTDWEVELAVVIGKKASYVDEKNALDYVAGYCLHNDYSEREFQLERNGQWVKGKSCDTFAPMGPYLVTKDEVPNYNSLHMWLKVNGRTMQDNNTDDMIFEVPFLIHYISQFMTLLPGDVISTGTPAGVGLGFKPPIYLKVGDVVELGIEGLGEQRQVAK
ncbi:fumarylacetoacetate hydrolase family protein [Ohtaekwangia koreensis]|uniref:2-keto-4-pentenoate hydratase/2-oxohepta-3-ene-1,7-dioic acid hydratase (Catechol pathway) n=1 Tax=Ohtaekwangia koreensis TaxID=688867 RepID=A0A1T5MFG4_9BACT|nr:fumarylacetoacetate hydrolase family protein [Ohtaekwangia koreensis]SKC86813.1 2-keto-4-pentenoate hydratase/2-oxohepta-3-ene-1,7-dioic acid hydratase (catechol pathway) [Ohtaekwangia koreensis]